VEGKFVLHVFLDICTLQVSKTSFELIGANARVVADLATGFERISGRP